MRKKTPKDIINSFNNQKFMKFLNAEVFVKEPGTCQISIQQGENLTQQHGLFHGGVISTLADNSAAFAATSLMEKDREPLTIECKVNFIDIADGEKIWAEGKVLSAGKTIYHAESRVYTGLEDEVKLCAVALVTIKSTLRVEELSL